MVGEADVVIKYEFMPTESSIKAGAEKIAKRLDKQFGRSIGGGGGTSSGGSPVEKASKRIEKSTEKMEKSFDLFDYSINVLRMTQEKTSLQTKLSSARKVMQPILEPIQATMEKFKLIESRAPAISPTGIGQGEGGENVGQAAAGGGMMGSLGIIIGLLSIVVIAMVLISAFFDAVGPIIKMFMKVLSAIFLILLAPILRRVMPVIGELIKGVIGGAKAVAGGMDVVFDSIGNLIMGALFSPIKDILFDTAKVIVQGITILLFSLAKVITSTVFDAAIGLLEGFKMLGSYLLALGGADSGTIQKFTKGVAEIQNVLGYTRNDILKTLDNLQIVMLYAEERFFESMKELTNGGWEDVYTIATQWMTDLVSKSNEIFFPGGGGITPAGAAAAKSIFGGMNGVIQGGNGPIDGSQGGSGPWGGQRYPGTHTPGGGPDLAIAQDFISRPGGGVMKFSPNDTIIGMKNPGAMGGQTINTTLNVSAGVDKKEFRKLLTEFGRQQGRELRTRTSYYGGQ